MNAGVGVLRGYLANAEKVRVRGVEFDGTARAGRSVSFYGAAAYTDGSYVSFPDAPPPLEDTGGPQVKDISGSLLPGISKWALSFGGEYAKRTTLFGRAGEFFGALDASYRSSFSSSAIRLALSRRRRLLAAQRARRVPLDRRLDAVVVVAQPARQELLRAADGRARQHRALCRPAWRSPDDWTDDARHAPLGSKLKSTRASRERSVPATICGSVRSRSPCHVVDSSCLRVRSGVARYRAHVNRLTNSSAFWATSRQPASIVSACPRPGILTISVTPLLRFCFL